MTMAAFEARRIPFAAGSARSGPLTWAQRAIRSSIDWLGQDSYYFSIPMVLEVPCGCTTDHVASALAALLERNEALRTRFLRDDDGLRQVVSATGTLTLRVFESPGAATADGADIVSTALWSVPFDHESEWPLRCALTTVEHQPRFLVLVLSHQAVDGAGLTLCINQ